MLPTPRRMAESTDHAPHVPHGRYPYPKQVWSPAGGWWTRPKNWATNTAISAGVIFLLSWGIFRFSAANEKRLVPPHRPIPSQMWAKEFKDGTVKVEDY